MAKQQGIPTYSLDQFKSVQGSGLPFQIEIFDATRHFEVQYPHRHDFFEVLYLTNGSGIHVIDSNEYRIQPPCVFFLSPGQTHKLELSKDIAGYIFLFTAEFYLLDRSNKNKLLELPFFFNLNQENPPLLLPNTSDQSFLTSLFKQGINQSNGKFTNSLLDLILLKCEQLYPKEGAAIAKGKGHVMVKRFRELIEENYQSNWGIKEYASILHITENHLTHTVKSLTSKTSKQLIRDKQILEIKRLLKHSDLSISEISNHLNFADQSYFSKFFKKFSGHSPNEYRTKSLKST